MKIIKTGTVPAPPPVWVGVRMKCRKCGCEFELDENDKPRTSTERHTAGRTTVVHDCPTPGCDTNVAILLSLSLRL